MSLGGHKWLRLLLIASGLYLLLLPLWWYSMEALVAMVCAPADWIYHFFNPQVTIKPDGRAVKVVIAVTGGDPVRSGLRLDTITYGLPMLAALTLVTRAESYRAKARALGLGLMVMFALTVPAVMMWARLSVLQMEESLSPAAAFAGGNRSGFFYYAFHGYAFSQPALAVGLWLALVMLGMFREKPRVKKAPTSRNAPCPCGSGRKYKLCCGRE